MPARRVGPVLIAAAFFALRGTAVPARATSSAARMRDERPTAMAASDAPWLSDDAPPLRILYRAPSASAASALTTRAPDAYARLSAALGVVLPTPFTLRLYESDDAYAKDHPLGRLVSGVWAEEHRPRREAAVVVPRTTDDAVDMGALDIAVRYALGHQLLAHASNGRLPGAFQEGIARLFMPPTSATQAGVATLRAAHARGALVPWSDLSAPGSSYLKPDITYPESLSIAVYVVQTRGFECLAALPAASASDVPFREAFTLACGTSFDDAEAAWRLWLPSYVDGGWREHPLFSPDLGPARQLLAIGEDGRVAALLRAVVAVTPPGAAADDARSLLARAEGGAASNRTLGTAVAALAGGDYARARTAAAEAKTRAAEVGADGVVDNAAELDSRAAMGLRADADASRADRLPPWRVFEARRAAAAAATSYARLGNDVAAARARAVLERLDGRLAPIGWLCLFAGVALLAHAVRRRRRLSSATSGSAVEQRAPAAARPGPTADQRIAGR
ncbi:MAG: hypothetical protein ABI780_02810 [Ardenticatenales bacterium]